MRFPIFKSFSSVRRSGLIDSAITKDADDLIRLWGAVAFDKATDLSWKEDSGLVPSSGAGHWWRVRREIERRLGQGSKEPIANFAA